MERLFHIEMLIRDLIVEDQFNAKYTKNQKSIFCKNMYDKISKFLKNREEEILDRLNRRYLNQQHELDETKRQLEQYRMGYHLLQQNHSFDNFAHSVLNMFFLIYFYYSMYQWITATTPTDQSQKPRQIM
jgi:hypothetical protein